ncbi:Hypothetical protein G436_4110 [Leptospira interrogans serovar Hardjo str. Norma]|uniref:Uncharacterized protein n=1 Tax=Leptospira interrogans serovar Hardjo str. Norma TaxID=1279460 RepID=A0A0M4NNA2_LEPIR|nr:Hypothetical protein G436_4110 [Leptospira interrogans serovar Hardjo str. Norma]
MQKVCFSDREKFSEPYHPHPKIGKTQHNALYGSRLKLSKTLSTDRVLGRNSRYLNVSL